MILTTATFHVSFLPATPSSRDIDDAATRALSEVASLTVVEAFSRAKVAPSVALISLTYWSAGEAEGEATARSAMRSTGLPADALNLTHK